MIDFSTRLKCPACGDTRFSSIWSGRFSDPAVRSMLDRFFYSTDLEESLGDQVFSLVTCNGCEFRFHSRVITDEWVPAVYGEWISREQIEAFEAAHVSRPLDSFDERLSGLRFLMRLHRLATANGSHQDGLSLLDFGCGDGRLIALARALGITAFGVDISGSRMQVADAHGCIVFSTMDALLAAVKSPFQIVILNQVLEHVRDPDAVLKALARCMAPEGILFVGVPNCWGIGSPRSFEEFHSVQPIEHINCFTPSSLKSFVETRGFVQVRRPQAFVTTNVIKAIKSMAGVVIQKASTDQYFKRTTTDLGFGKVSTQT